MKRLYCLLALTVAAPALADDWPQWLGPKRDSVWRETGILTRFPSGGPKVLWRGPIGPGYTGPAVADGKGSVMDRALTPGVKNHTEPFPMRPNKAIAGMERIICLNAADGKEVWK